MKLDIFLDKTRLGYAFTARDQRGNFVASCVYMYMDYTEREAKREFRQYAKEKASQIFVNIPAK